MNVLLISASLSLSIVYVYDPDEKERITVDIFTILIMIMNICIEIFQSKRINDYYKSNYRTYKCKVFRKGKLVSVLREELKIGDILDLSHGDIVGADSRIIKAHNLKVNLKVKR